MEHMQYLILSVLVLTHATTCRSNEILINGISTDRKQFCGNERLTLVCRNNTNSYAWRIAVLQAGEIVISAPPGVSMKTVDGFTATFISSNKTTLEFEVSNSLDGLTITCINFVGTVNLSATNVEVHGRTCPRINAVGDIDDRNVTVSLSQTSVCTLAYIANITNGTEVIYSTYVSNMDSDNDLIDLQNFVLSDLDLDFLISMYEISITAVYNNGSMTCPNVPVNLPQAVSTVTGHVPKITATATSSTPRSMMSVIPIVVPVLVVILLLVLTITVIILVISVLTYKKQRARVKPEESVQMVNQTDLHDPLPHQDSKTIMHEMAPDGAVYAMVDNKNKRSNKKSSKSDNHEETALNRDKDSKDKNKKDMLMYADIAEHDTSKQPTVVYVATQHDEN